MVSELLNKRELVDKPVALNVQLSGLATKPGKFSFGQYLNEILLPVWTERVDSDDPLQELRDRADLTPILANLAANPEVYLIHNQDDFIVTAEHLKQLTSALGERATIYPHGGHLGNLWFPPNQQRVRDIFAPLLDPNP
jgi:hypothetical protein